MTEAFVLDRPLILDRLGGDEEIFAMMVDMYLQDVVSNVDTLKVALAKDDATTLMREAHTIKGLLATFSDDAGAARAFDLERKAKLGNLVGLAPLVSELQARLCEVAAVLRQQVGVTG